MRACVRALRFSWGSAGGARYFGGGCRGLRETKCRAAVVVKSENEVQLSPNSVSPELQTVVWIQDDLFILLLGHDLIDLPLKLQHLVSKAERRLK